ncbi:SYTL [Mytilus edulis]|uniref:SYTL n=1 Tax=Mytilus edulis TaxID=6550 RepID=A0A8S3UBC1_MYTED|nr:SYTL [Mytilus edulis]
MNRIFYEVEMAKDSSSAPFKVPVKKNNTEATHSDDCIPKKQAKVSKQTLNVVQTSPNIFQPQTKLVKISPKNVSNSPVQSDHTYEADNTTELLNIAKNLSTSTDSACIELSDIDENLSSTDMRRSGKDGMQQESCQLCQKVSEDAVEKNGQYICKGCVSLFTGGDSQTNGEKKKRGRKGKKEPKESRESIVSFYSNAGDVDYGKIPITGDIQFGMDYNYRTGTLEIHITQCKGLAPADTRRNRSDPYIKTYLLPDKTRSGKRKTKIKKHTLNPVFDEKLRYLISKSELENRTLWVTVWHNDRFGRNDFLGEVTINFDYYRFGDSASKWYKLQERFEQPTSLLTYKGDIILCLKKKARKPKLPGDKGQLHVLIKEARNLTAVRSNGYSDPFCKGQLQPDKEKQKTQVIKKECNPAWNCTMVFEDVTAENLREKSLELTIWDHDKLSSNDFLGGVRLNLGTGKSYSKLVDWMDARGEEISLWQAMVDRPNFWIDGALVLRSTMSKRK